MEVLVLAFVLEAIATSFELSSVGKGLIGSASFFGMLVGAGFWSIYADKRGRRTAFVSSLACVFVGGVLSSLAPSFFVLCLCRVLVGFGVGGNLPVTTALVTEFLPTNDRANILCATAGIFWGIGMIFASLLGLMLANVLGPGKEEAMWRWFLGVAALPSAIVAVAYRLLPESPRFLQVMGRHDEAMQMTMTLSLSPTDLDSGGGGGGGGGGEAVAAGIGDAASHGQEAENAEAGDVRELFHTPILRRITLSFYFGVTFLLPRYYDKISGGQANFVYILSALVGATFIPGAFAAMWLCSERRLGRVGALKWSSYATAAAVILLATTLRVKAVFAVASILTLFITTIPGTVKYVLTPEIYSTKYRTVGLGSTSVVTRLGGLLAPVLAEVLYDGWGPVAPLLVFGPIMVITGIAAGCI
ncbi:major facilitator transporter [Ectocarpus siliculosus]|uniref:Major facilitator transporter n=1 Tax=Ectocarpus siliculosus TaxID=2880 RepID=D8LR80_ECTSI|nr:major facilitator transporter [Ectocarpus siliculosus]|eukprot:CBN77753.1 major facilitator transporter [Ectocarpus siliculosus]